MLEDAKSASSAVRLIDVVAFLCVVPPEPTGWPLMYTCKLEVVVTAVVVELAGVDGVVVVVVDGVVVVVVDGAVVVVVDWAVVVVVTGAVVVVVDGAVAWVVEVVVVETGVVTGVVVVVVVVIVVGAGEGGVDDTVVTGAGDVGVRLAPGIRAAAAARFSSPIVMPVTESWTGVGDCWIQFLIWSTVGREPNLDW
jgi:hypothetical protein